MNIFAFVSAVLLLSALDIALAAPQPLDITPALLQRSSLANNVIKRSTSNQQRYKNALSYKKNLASLQGARQFCTTFLHGEMPSQPYTTLKGSTTTSVVTPQATVTSTVITETSTTSTLVGTSTPLTTTVATVQSTVTVHETAITTETFTTTNTQPPARKRDIIKKRRDLLIRASVKSSSDFSFIQGLGHRIIEDACLLYLYHTLQYPTKTVTPSIVTITSTAATSFSTTTTSTTKVDSFSATLIITAPTSVISDTVTLSAATKTTTDATSTTSTTTAVPSAYATSGIFNIQYGFRPPMYFTNYPDYTIFLGNDLNTAIEFDLLYPQGANGFSGYLYSRSYSDATTFYPVVVVDSNNQVISSTDHTTSGKTPVVCLADQGPSRGLSCAPDGITNTANYLFYRCDNNLIYLDNQSPASGCTPLQVSYS